MTLREMIKSVARYRDNLIGCQEPWLTSHDVPILPCCLSTSDVFLLAGKPVTKPLRVNDCDSAAGHVASKIIRILTFLRTLLKFIYVS